MIDLLAVKDELNSLDYQFVQPVLLAENPHLNLENWCTPPNEYLLLLQLIQWILVLHDRLHCDVKRVPLPFQDRRNEDIDANVLIDFLC